MGCCASHPSNEQVDEYLSGNIGADYFPKDETDISDYHCEGVHGQTIVKKPNDLKGEDFVIENCKVIYLLVTGSVPSINHCTFHMQDTNIYLMDYTAAVTIDCCEDCQIFIGPCKGSVFIRESKRCVIMASCQQFRVRDSAFCTFYLHCTTQPVIENSMETKFGCFSCYYPELSDQLVKANLSPLNNNWHSVHNFNPDYYNAWRLIRPNDGSLRLRAHEIVSISFYNNNSTVPFTTGSTYPDANIDVCVVMFRNSDHSSRALKFIKEINNLVFNANSC
jgi:protein XRP2